MRVTQSDQRKATAMSQNLMNDLMKDFRGDALNRVASAVGESPAKTEAALGGVLPAVVGGLVEKASTANGATGLLDLIHRSKLDTAQFADPSAAVTAPNGVTNLIDTGKPLMDFALG